MDAAHILKAKRERILQIAAKHGVHKVRVFGSTARGDADEQSDIDLLVDMPAGSTLLDQAALLLELQDALGCKVDVLTEQGLKPRVRERVIREAMPL
jgi:predicted nucleotidyltransferase